jgi:hypothetical protein
MLNAKSMRSRGDAPPETGLVREIFAPRRGHPAF